MLSLDTLLTQNCASGCTFLQTLSEMVVSSNVRSSVANESISLDYNSYYINASGMQIRYDHGVRYTEQYISMAGGTWY